MEVRLGCSSLGSPLVVDTASELGADTQQLTTRRATLGRGYAVLGTAPSETGKEV